MNRFDLENAMMKCWNVVDDIDDVVKFVNDLDLDPREKDQLSNILIGLSAIYDLRHKRLNDLYEKMLKGGMIRNG